MSKEHPVIICDLDRTLVKIHVDLDDIARWKVRLNETFGPFGWTEGFSPMLPCLERALELASDQMDSAEVSEFREQVYRDLDDWEDDAIGKIEVIEPIADAVCRWRLQQTPIAIVTNSGPKAARKGLHALARFARGRGLGRVRFPTVVHRGADLPAKPNPTCMRRALEGLSPEISLPDKTVLSIGDAPGDWEAANALSGELGIPIYSIAVRDDRLCWPSTGPPVSQSVATFLASLGLSA